MTETKISVAELSAILDDAMIELSLKYAGFYQSNARNFITCFIKFASIKTACAFIVQSYKHLGVFAECVGDFSDYANRQPIAEKWKPVLADVLLIIYSIMRPK